MTAAQKVTVPALRARKRTGPKIAVVTAYDATFGRLFEEGGADVLLVGDSLGMVVQGQATTLGVTLDDMIYHGRAVARGASRAHVLGDLPFMSYQTGPIPALEAAGRMLKEGGYEAVKLEGGERYAEHVRAIVGAGIPVMGHVGLLPQSVHAMGGYKVQGTDDAGAQRIVADARALEQAGVYAIVLEAIPAELARRVTDSVGVPTIGIGAGPHCDGQVLVGYDLLGMVSDLKPKFVKRYAEGGKLVVEAMRSYVNEVRSGTFPAAAHSFGVPRERAGAAEATGASPVVVGAPPSYGPASDGS
ncbi:MAG TPA: 3-methyl-2-oxobutanoate hydroxymethyltransferase [Polyangiaceae bacterium]